WPLGDYARHHGAALDARIHDFLAHARDRLDRDAYLARLRTRAEMQARYAALLDALGSDAVIMPAASGIAPEGLAWTGSRTCQMYASWLGQPALGLPLLQVAAMPFGVQLLGRAGADPALFAAAAGLEAMLG
ncbi:MAG: hypothetical protein RLO22_10475, partial [Sneathiellaceae bacterium]